jgi:hypothetical protein
MEQTAIETCKGWFDSRAGQLQTHCIELECQGEENGKAVFWLYAPKHLVDVTVWDHAFCLDVLVMDSNTNEMVFSEAGECATSRGVCERLERFWTWYESQSS